MAWYPNTVSLMVHRRFAPGALPALDPFTDRPEVNAFFDLPGVEDFAEFDGLPEVRPRPTLPFPPEEVVWRRGDFLLRLPDVD